MKKTSLIGTFFLVIFLNSYIISSNSMHYPAIVKRPCYTRFKDETYTTYSGFNTSYRKRIGEEYLKEMLEDKRREREQIQTARLQKIEHQEVDYFLNNPTEVRQNQNQNNKTEIQRIPVPPKRTAPTYTHLRSACNRQEMQELFMIKSILVCSLPEIDVVKKTPRITQFDIQPQGSYFYRK